jgi:RNA polymerase sigma-70 factor (ECF subfamily)
MPDSDNGEAFGAYRPLLFSIAYRMLGSVMDAEDMVQETYLRWQRAGPGTVQEPKAFLTTVVTRLSIDHLRSARVQRESYIGPWLPEPLLTEPGGGPAEKVAERESLSLAYLVMLERLSPVERAALLLREVFGHDYAELAQILETSQANARQLVSRARRKLDRLGMDRVHYTTVPEQQMALARQFVQAVASGDIGRVLGLLAPEVSLVSDGGGKAVAVRRPIMGAQGVAHFFVSLARIAPAGAAGTLAWINGSAALVIFEGGEVTTVFVPVIDNGQIIHFYAFRNPDKLRSLPRQHEVPGAFPLS